MKKLIVISFVFLVLLMSCTDPEGTTAFLKSQGYTNIEITGFDAWAKGKEDWSCTGFIATGFNGKRVTGAVSDKGVFYIGPKKVIRIWHEE